MTGLGKVIGYESDHMTVATRMALRDDLQPARLVDIAALTMVQRMHKSAAELDLIRAGAAVARAALDLMGGAYGRTVHVVAEGATRAVEHVRSLLAHAQPADRVTGKVEAGQVTRALAAQVEVDASLDDAK